MSSDSGIEPEAQKNEKETLIPAPKAKRILAFGMDFVLLIFVSALLYIYIPKLHGKETEAEFVRYTSQLSESFLSSQAKGANPDQELITRFSEFTIGIMGNEVLDQAGVQNVANLPTLDEARAKIVGILATPASKFVSILLARSEKMSSLSAENSEKQPKE